MNSKNVLVVQHIDIETPGIIADLMTKKNIGFDCKNLNSDYENLLDYDALIIMGGPMSVNEKSRYSFIDGDKNSNNSFVMSLANTYEQYLDENFSLRLVVSFQVF